MSFYHDILQSLQAKRKLLAILLDPEKIQLDAITSLCEKIKKSPATHVFFGGSTYDGNDFSEIIKRLKQELDLPIFLFPGDYNQISEEADVLLFLSLVSGRNPEYLIGQQIKAVDKLEKSSLEIIPTAYLLIESGIETAVERVSETKPLNRNNL
ncbi:MAG: geranylgeranylglyceryl/heptaprenylglyceryl phosphate synthase, partial [Flavobacteriaceae bacterium]|nr:geranylgeranylglyceryl/heptaprenylglyceryl phosphate synthase [Flavobacteriaceae bacterium]